MLEAFIAIKKLNKAERKIFFILISKRSKDLFCESKKRLAMHNEFLKT